MSGEKIVCLLVGLHGLLNKCLHLDCFLKITRNQLLISSVVSCKAEEVTVQSNIAISVIVLHSYNI